MRLGGVVWWWMPGKPETALPPLWAGTTAPDPPHEAGWHLLDVSKKAGPFPTLLGRPSPLHLQQAHCSSWAGPRGDPELALLPGVQPGALSGGAPQSPQRGWLRAFSWGHSRAHGSVAAGHAEVTLRPPCRTWDPSPTPHSLPTVHSLHLLGRDGEAHTKLCYSRGGR